MQETPIDSWVGKIPWEGKGYPLQYSGLKNWMDSIVHGVAKSRTQLNDFHFHFQMKMGFSGGPVVKDPSSNAGDVKYMGLIPG